jgi:hypothetical protein
MPFDADAGPGIGGTPTVVYSRCAHDPTGTLAERGGSQYVDRPDWTNAHGCRIYESALTGGGPRLIAGIRPGRASDATPAIWYGDIAFARVAPGSHVSTIYYWHHAGGALDRLGAGQPPCTVGCIPGPRASWVDGMSLDGQLLAFEWSTNAAPFGEGPFPEIRVDPLRFGHQSGPAQVIEETAGSGACGFSEGRSASVLAAAMSYAVVFGDCGRNGRGAEEVDSAFDTYSAASRRWQRAPGAATLVVALAQERGATYWIGDKPVAPASEPPPSSECTPGFVACFEPAFEYSGDCAPAHGQCTLMRTANPGYGRTEVRHPGAFG